MIPTTAIIIGNTVLLKQRPKQVKAGPIINMTAATNASARFLWDRYAVKVS